MAVVGYALLVVSLGVALLCMAHVWIHGLAHALGGWDRTPAGQGRKLFWVAVMVVFGWFGAVTYWLIGCPRSG